MLRLNKEETKNAETKTTPILNILTMAGNKETLIQKTIGVFKDISEESKLKNAISNSQNWLFTDSINSTKDGKNHLINKLGSPNYHANYEYREAVWGFKKDNIDIIVYYSTKGFTVQVSDFCTMNQATLILKEICSKLESN